MAILNRCKCGEIINARAVLCDACHVKVSRELEDQIAAAKDERIKELEEEIAKHEALVPEDLGDYLQLKEQAEAADLVIEKQDTRIAALETRIQTMTRCIEKGERIAKRLAPAAQSYFGEVHRALEREGDCPVVASEIKAHTVENIKKMRRAQKFPGVGDPSGDRPGAVYCTGCGLGYRENIDGKPCFSLHCPGTFRAPEPTSREYLATKLAENIAKNPDHLDETIRNLERAPEPECKTRGDSPDGLFERGPCPDCHPIDAGGYKVLGVDESGGVRRTIYGRRESTPM